MSSTYPAAAARLFGYVWPPPRGKMPSAISRRYSRAGSPMPTNSTSGFRPNSLNEDQRRVHRQALAGMLWGKQYYYFDLEHWLREHKSHPLLESTRTGRAQHRMVPHAEQRCDLDAGQVGVSVVCGLGSGVPHDHSGAGGFRLRQGTAVADAAQPVLPSQRTDSRVRVEFQRRKSSCARVGYAVAVQIRDGRWGGQTCDSWNDRFKG